MLLFSLVCVSYPPAVWVDVTQEGGDLLGDILTGKIWLLTSTFRWRS